MTLLAMLVERSGLAISDVQLFHDLQFLPIESFKKGCTSSPILGCFDGIAFNGSLEEVRDIFHSLKFLKLQCLQIDLLQLLLLLVPTNPQPDMCDRTGRPVLMVSKFRRLFRLIPSELHLRLVLGHKVQGVLRTHLIQMLRLQLDVTTTTTTIFRSHHSMILENGQSVFMTSPIALGRKRLASNTSHS
jgi:hypothetical protein